MNPWCEAFANCRLIVNLFSLVFINWSIYNIGHIRGYVAGMKFSRNLWEPLVDKLHRRLMGEDPPPEEKHRNN